jgi:CelD/BcsL family acetyltransferase involved in cellulose biosynthesis
LPDAQRERAAGALELEALPDLESVRDEWQELAERSGNVFSTWEWASTWWDHFGRGRPLALLGCRRRDGTLAGILPFYEAARRPLRVLRFIGHSLADVQGPVCAAADFLEVAAGSQAALARPGVRHGLLLAERLPGAVGAETRLGGRVLRREPSPTLRFESSTWDDFLASRSRNFRQQARRRERQLANRDLRFRRCVDPNRLDADLDTLFRLHDARWQGRGSAGFSPPNRPFHRSFAAHALATGWLRLWFAEIAEEPVAAWYGFRFGRSEWYYQSGRLLGAADQSVGFVLLNRTIRSALEDGMEEYRLLLGDETYKSRYATEDLGVETVAVTRGPAARAALLGARVALAGRRAARRAAELARMRT